MMNGWIFFSPGKNTWQKYDRDFEAVFLAMPGMNPLSREEWHAYMPESGERLQGRSLGFFCGGGSGISCCALPDYPLRVFTSDYVIMPSCWTDQVFLTVAAGPVEKKRVFRVPAEMRTMTVTGTFPDNPPYFRVYGSYCFFPPQYRLRTGGNEKD